MATDKNTLKSWFQKGLKPLAAQFAAWMDSYWHKDETIPVSSIENLDVIMSSKANQAVVDSVVTELQNKVDKEEGMQLVSSALVEDVEELILSNPISETEVEAFYATKESVKEIDFFQEANGEYIQFILNWENPDVINDGYCMFRSAIKPYVLYHGENPYPSNDYFTTINILDLIDIVDGKIYAKEQQYDWEFIVSSIDLGSENEGKSILIKSRHQQAVVEGEYWLWQSSNGNINPALQFVSWGLKPIIFPKYGDIPIAYVKDLSDRLLDYKPKYSRTINKTQILWDNGYIKIDNPVNVENYVREVTDVVLFAKFSSGIIRLNPIVHYPSAETYNGSVYTGFLLRDEELLLREDSDFEQITIMYNANVQASVGLIYNSNKEFFGNNIIMEHPSNSTENINHANTLMGIFHAIYSDYEGTYTDTILDELTNFGGLENKYKSTYCKIKEASLIIYPIVNGATSKSTSSNPNILTVAAHYDNTFTRKNITSGASIFLENVIAVNSCVLNGTPGVGTCTSYGYGVEFTEDLAILSDTFPSFNVEWINPVYQESTSCLAVGIKLHKIKEATGATWTIVREAARATASNNGVWDMYRGFGVIDMAAAIQYISDNYIENSTYRSLLADKLEVSRGLPPFLKYEDLLPNSPVSKKMLEENGVGNGSSDVVNYITGSSAGATYNILRGTNVINNCLAAGTHIFSLPVPDTSGKDNLMTVKFRTCLTAPTITRTLPLLDAVGTVSNAANSAVLTGVGTTFTDFRDGDVVNYAGADRTVLSVTSDTQMTLVANVVEENTDVAYKYYPPLRIFGGVVPVWGISEIRAIFYEYVKYANTFYLEISYSSNAN